MHGKFTGACAKDPRETGPPNKATPFSGAVLLTRAGHSPAEDDFDFIDDALKGSPAVPHSGAGATAAKKIGGGSATLA